MSVTANVRVTTTGVADSRSTLLKGVILHTSPTGGAHLILADNTADQVMVNISIPEADSTVPVYFAQAGSPSESGIALPGGVRVLQFTNIVAMTLIR